LKKEYPNKGELVLARVKKILRHGAFCHLPEYDKEAFLHVSEVAPRWIKNIHEFLTEGKLYVARVIRVFPERGMIDVSIKRVTDKEKEYKLGQIKREKRAHNLVLLAAKKARLRKAKLEEYVDLLTEEFGDLYTALEEMSESGEEAIKGLKLSKGFSKHILQIAKENIKKPLQRITGVLTFTSYSPDGVEDIKRCLGNIKVKLPPESRFDIVYMGAPKYRLTVHSRDFKVCESILRTVLQQIGEYTKGREIVYSFQKEKGR